MIHKIISCTLFIISISTSIPQVNCVDVHVQSISLFTIIIACDDESVINQFSYLFQLSEEEKAVLLQCRRGSVARGKVVKFEPYII